MKIDISAPEGNVFCIMGVVSTLLKQTGRKDEVKGVMARMRSGNYANACAVATEVSYGSIEFYNSSKTDWE